MANACPEGGRRGDAENRAPARGFRPISLFLFFQSQLTVLQAALQGTLVLLWETVPGEGWGWGWEWVRDQLTRQLQLKASTKVAVQRPGSEFEHCGCAAAQVRGWEEQAEACTALTGPLLHPTPPRLSSARGGSEREG